MTAVPERQVWLLRHAKSSWDSDAPTDYDRPLGKRGRRDAPRMGAWMAEEGLVPDRIVTSPARRAEETLALLLEGMELEPTDLEVEREEQVYDALVSDLLDVLRDLPEATRRVLLVGHNPAFDEVLMWLVDDPVPRTDTGKLMTTCTLARVGFEGRWADLEPGAARLLGLKRPRDL